MPSNESLLRKADLAIADLQANGGELLPEQAAAFIRKLIKQPVLINRCRVVEMMSPKRKINRIGFGQRILRKAANNEASNTGPGALRQTIIDMIAERAALDTEELGLLGDTAYVNGSDADDQAFLSQLDGWLKIVNTADNIANAANATISKEIFKAGLKTMPVQYQRNKAALNHFVSVNQETEYRDTLADRGTGLGDSMVQGNSPVFAYGSPISPTPMMPESKGLFTDPLNLIFGIQRQVSMEFDKDITARVYIIVLTMRVDFKIETPEAAVVYENIAS